jgi:uncharacterized membrane protein
LNGWWDSFLRWVGFAVCHQLPERTIHFGGRPLFLCARDTGLYAGFFLCLAVAVMPYRKSRGGSPSLPWKAAAALSLLYLAVDGGTVALGWRESNHVLRLTSGLAAGASLALLLGPAVNRLAWGAPPEQRLMRGKLPGLCLGLALAAAAALFLAHPSPLLAAAQAFLLACLTGTLLYLNAALLASAGAGLGRRMDSGARLAALAISFPLVVGELILLHHLHALLAR